MEVLKKCEKELDRAAAIQLCYDGKIINKMNRYTCILLGQFVDKEKKCEKVIVVETFQKGRSVTAESVFILDKVYSVMPGTTALNTGKMAGVNERLADFYRLHHDRNIHSLECLFNVNEIYFTHAIAKIKGKKERTMNDGRRIIDEVLWKYSEA